MQKILAGKVVSNKQAKTVIVEVERFFKHPLYERRQRVTKRYHIHTQSVLQVGEVVRFVETHPLSKTKRWKALEEISPIRQVLDSEAHTRRAQTESAQGKQVSKAKEHVEMKSEKGGKRRSNQPKDLRKSVLP